MNIQEETTAALRGEPSPILIYWDKQDPRNEGPAWRTTEDSGSLEFTGRWASTTDARANEGYELWAYFGNDGAYLGPDMHGVYPVLA